MDIFLILLIVVCLFGIIFLFSSKGKPKPIVPRERKKIKTDQRDPNKILDIIPKTDFLKPVEVEFITNVARGIDSAFVIFPKISICDLSLPKLAKFDFSSLKSKTVDFLVFEKSTMVPKLAIDLFDNSFGNESLADFDALTISALKTLNIPLFSVQIDSLTFKEIIEQINQKISISAQTSETAEKT